DRQALTRVFIEDGEALQPPPILGLVMDEVIAPDMVGILSPYRCRRALPHRAPFPLFLNDLEPLVLPYTTYRLPRPPPVFTLQQGINLLIPNPWIALRQGMNPRNDFALFTRAWLPAFGTPVQCQHATGTPLADVIRLFEIGGGLPLGSQAYQFFP